MTADIKISPEMQKLLEGLEIAAEEFVKQIAQEIRGYIWDKYAVDGLSPRLIRKACEEY